MKRFIHTILLTLSVIGATGQSADFNNIFNYTYPLPSYEYVHGLTQLANGDFIISGTSGSYDDNVNSQAFLMRVDSLGAWQWFKYYGTDQTDNGRNVVLMNNGDLLFCGFSDGNGSNDYDMFVTRTDSDGNELWTKFYGGPSWDIAHYVDATTDGGFVLVGETYSYGNGANDGYMIRCDANGDTLWTKVFGGAGADVLRCVKATADGGMAAIGYTEEATAGGKDIWIIKTDANGDTLWTKKLGGSRDDEGNFIDESDSGDLIISANNSSDPGSDGDIDYMNCIYDASGTEINCVVNTAFGSQTNNETGEFIRQSSDGEFINAGTVDGFNDQQSIMLVKLNDVVVYLWNRLIGTELKHTEEIGGFIVDIEGGYAIAGHTDFGDGPQNVFLVRTTDQPSHDNTGVTGIRKEQELIATGISVYPNPTKDVVNLSLSRDHHGKDVLVRVIDQLGRNITLDLPPLKSGNNRLDLSELDQGMYYLVVTIDGLSVGKPIIKQ